MSLRRTHRENRRVSTEPSSVGNDGRFLIGAGLGLHRTEPCPSGRGPVAAPDARPVASVPGFLLAHTHARIGAAGEYTVQSLAVRGTVVILICVL